MRQIMLAVVAAVGMSGCVTQGMYQRGTKEAYQNGFKDADGQCVKLQMQMKAGWDTMTKELADKTEKLKKYTEIEDEEKVRDVIKKRKAGSK